MTAVSGAAQRREGELGGHHLIDPGLDRSLVVGLALAPLGQEVAFGIEDEDLVDARFELEGRPLRREGKKQGLGVAVLDRGPELGRSGRQGRQLLQAIFGTLECQLDLPGLPGIVLFAALLELAGQIGMAKPGKQHHQRQQQQAAQGDDSPCEAESMAYSLGSRCAHASLSLAEVEKERLWRIRSGAKAGTAACSNGV
ncbi:hypothetical protein Q427_21310 [Halomonas sp. BC04]|nr:hypothetical protein Q427_21310 [Halomonas sp. BC04]